MQSQTPCGAQNFHGFEGIQGSVAACMGSVVAAHQLTCPEACRILPNQGLSPVPCTGRQILNHWTTREVWSTCLLKAQVSLLKEACSSTFFFLIHTTAPCVLIENLIHLYLTYLLVGNDINMAIWHFYLFLVFKNYLLWALSIFFLKDNYSIVLVFAIHKHGSVIGIRMFPPSMAFFFFSVFWLQHARS